MILFLNILAVTYTLIWLGTSVWCVKLGTNDSIFAFLFLSAIYWGFWRQEIFDSPSETLSFHFLLMIIMLPSSKSLFWRLFFGGLSLMAVADSVWLTMPKTQPYLMRYIPEMAHNFPYAIFWWQSLLIIMFIILCVHTLVMNYYTHRLDKLNRELEHGNFWASISIFAKSIKMHIVKNSPFHSHHKQS